MDDRTRELAFVLGAWVGAEPGSTIQGDTESALMAWLYMHVMGAWPDWAPDNDWLTGLKIAYSEDG